MAAVLRADPGRARRPTAPPLHAVTTAQGGAAGAPLRHTGAAGCGASRGSEPGRGPVVAAAERGTQLLLDLGDRPGCARQWPARLSGTERVRAELDVLGLDVSTHVMDVYAPLLDAWASLVPAT